MSEEEILKECNQLFVTMINCHINGKPMADLLALYEQEKEKNKKLEEHQKQYLDGELITSNQGKFFEKIIKENYIRKDRIRAIIEDLNEKIKNATEIEAILMIKQQQILQKVLEE